MTTVTVEYVGETSTLDVDLRGHDAQGHCDQIMDAWLVKTAADAELEGDEDDAADWQVDDMNFTADGKVVFTAAPYRGDDATFTFTPPEA